MRIPIELFFTNLWILMVFCCLFEDIVGKKRERKTLDVLRATGPGRCEKKEAFETEKRKAAKRKIWSAVLDLKKKPFNKKKKEFAFFSLTLMELVCQFTVSGNRNHHWKSH